MGFNNYVFTLGSKLFSQNQLKNKKREEILEIINSISPSLKSMEKTIKNGYTSLEGIEIELTDVERVTKKAILTKSNKNSSVVVDGFKSVTFINNELDEDIWF